MLILCLLSVSRLKIYRAGNIRFRTYRLMVLLLSYFDKDSYKTIHYRV